MLNKVEYQGRFTSDPELKQTQSGISFVEFSIAWNKKIKENEIKCFLQCKAWRQTAEFICNYFSKGSEIIVDGHLVTEQWEKDGQKKSRTICEVEEVHFCGKKQESGASFAAEKTNSPFSELQDENCELPF